MLFSSTEFLFVFLPVLLVLYFLPVPQKIRRPWRNGVLLCFSIGFYAWGEPVFVFVMLAGVLLNWAGVIFMDRAKHRKAWLTVLVIMDIALLGVFKYASFLSKNIAALCGDDSLILDIALPIGISFFTFQMLSYVFDVYRGEARLQKNLLYVALYITLFPQLIAGPIVRYTEVETDILSRTESVEKFAAGFKRFIYGLGKKMLLANYMAQIADNIFDYAARPSVLTAWLGAVAYALQIYYDFSGYSDMAIGLGGMFGFRFSENFNYPYAAGSVTDFWRRWHISLSSWFRDYVYIPLGGSRVNKCRMIFNLLAVWLLTGIWHGANWTFPVWGLIYFAVLTFEKLTGTGKKHHAFTHAYTLMTVVLAWVVFRSANLKSAADYIGVMFGRGAEGFAGAAFASYIKGSYLVLAAALAGTLPLYRCCAEYLAAHKLGWLEDVWLFIVFALSVCACTGATYNPFIYFNF